MKSYDDYQHDFSYGFIWDKVNARFMAYILKNEYERNGMWPKEGVDISNETACEFMKQPPEGKILGADDNGMPAWIDMPPLTYTELVAKAKTEKQARIIEAVNYINNKQWQGKALLGRLNDTELKMYNIWLDYIEALEAIDPSKASDTAFPTKPFNDSV